VETQDIVNPTQDYTGSERCREWDCSGSQENTKERDQLFNDSKNKQRRRILRILRSLVLNTHL
jgi:hypothetical protein